MSNQNVNIISFSLWGNSVKYLHGALKNLELCPQIYPSFLCRFYCDIQVPNIIKYRIEDNYGEIVEMNEVGDYYNGMFWRFFAINDADVVLIRDTDSRLNERERYCVDEWLKSDKLYHTIHDHPSHCHPNIVIMPGLSGWKRSSLDIQKLIKEFPSENKYGVDYNFFAHHYDKICDNLFRHDDFGNDGHKFGIERNGLEFCGKVWDENENTVVEHENILKRALKK